MASVEHCKCVPEQNLSELNYIFSQFFQLSYKSLQSLETQPILIMLAYIHINRIFFKTYHYTGLSFRHDIIVFLWTADMAGYGSTSTTTRTRPAPSTITVLRS